jgi:hypothetical protein
VDVGTAARVLGISQAGVRKRLMRGHLQGYKVGGQWLVTLPSGTDGTRVPLRDRTAHPVGDAPPVAPSPPTPSRDELVDQLRAEVAAMRIALAASQAGEAELRRLLQQTLPPRLAAPVDTTVSTPQDAAVDAPRSDSDAVAQPDAVGMLRRRWWQVWKVST